VIDGFVLAGGASRRMGSDKARVPRDGWPAAAVSAAILRLGGCDRVALVRRDPEPPELPAWALPVESWVPDPGAPLEVILDPGGVDRHPLWGVTAALQASRADRCLVAACDLWFGAGDVRLLLAGPAECVASDSAGRTALFMVLRRERGAEVAALASRGAAVRELTDPLPRIALPDPAVANHNEARAGPIRSIIRSFGPGAAAGERARLAARGAMDPDDPL
jgi:molybdopterin-guanine dinucleotide biosynthesis protein A